MVDAWSPDWSTSAPKDDQRRRRVSRPPPPPPPPDDTTGGAPDPDAFIDPAIVAAEQAQLASIEINHQEVLLPSGATLPVLTDSEAEYVERLSSGYMEELKYESVGDLQDLDSVIRTELLIHRWESQLARGFDYYRRRTHDPAELARRVESKKAELRLHKKQLGIDATTRSKTSGKGSPAAWFAEVLEHAREFGIFRNDRAAESIEWLMYLIGEAQFIMQATDDERRALGKNPEWLVRKIHEEIAPAFLSGDIDWQQEVQQYWIRKQ